MPNTTRCAANRSVDKKRRGGEKGEAGREINNVGDGGDRESREMASLAGCHVQRARVMVSGALGMVMSQMAVAPSSEAVRSLVPSKGQKLSARTALRCARKHAATSSSDSEVRRVAAASEAGSRSAVSNGAESASREITTTKPDDKPAARRAPSVWVCQERQRPDACGGARPLIKSSADTPESGTSRTGTRAMTGRQGR